MGEERGLLLQFRILGPLEVVRAGEFLPFRGSRERALVALLVVHANRTVSAERLIEDLWSGDPPEGAIRSLRVYVSRLRQALGEAGQTVVTRPSGYELQVDPAAVDALRFEELVGRGRDQGKAEDHAGAAATLREALGLWRGPALADVADAPFARAEASRLEEARLSAVEDRIEADLACGRHGELTAELEALTREHPFRERLWSSRMVALYRSGRQADALRAYQDLRSTLGEQLGIEPSSALQHLEGAVLRHDPELDRHSGESVGRPTSAEPGPIPQPLRRDERVPFVGREVELARLEQIWQSTRSGQRHLVSLTGEPGIGKSRLAAEFARMTHAQGAVVLFGRCDEGMGVPYQPFVEALGRYLRQSREPVLGRLAGELARLVPEVGERALGLAPPLRSDPETERYRLFDAVASWLGAVCESEPVLFVLDDLHWATRPTLLLLSHLLRSDEELRLLLLVTFRDSPLDVTADLADVMTELLRLPGVERLRLAGLTEAGVGALMEAQAEQNLDAEGWALARIVYVETAGNPFYVREVLHDLAEKGDIVRREGRWVAGQPLAELNVPENVRDVVERRLTRLPDRTRELLSLAAVLGERFDLRVLSEASGAPVSSVVQALAAAIDARLVEETDAGRCRFIHALVRSTLEDALGPTRRLQLHRAAGLAVEAVYAGNHDPHLPHLAHHFAQARDHRQAVEYASRAGDRALAQLAHDEAAGYYRQALEQLDASDARTDDSRRCELLISLGEAQRRAGDPSYRDTLLRAARLALAAGDAERLVQAALANHRGVWSMIGETDADRASMLEAAIAAQPDKRSVVRARLLAQLAREVMFADDPDRTSRLVHEALDIIGDHAIPSARAEVLIPVALTIWAPGTVDLRLEVTADLLAAAEAAGDPVMVFWANVHRALAAFEVPDGTEASRRIAMAQQGVDELRQPVLRWVSRMLAANLAAATGRLQESEELAIESYRLGQATGQPDAAVYFGGNQFAVRFHQGRLSEIAGDLDRAAASAPALTITWRTMRAIVHCQEGQAADARPLFDAAIEELPDLPKDVAWLPTVVRLATVCAHLADVEGARELSALLAPYEQQAVATGVIWSGAVSHYLALLATVLGQFEQADEHFLHAEGVHERFGAAPWTARTRLEWARMLLAHRRPGDSDRAGVLLGRALVTARDLGLGGVERQALALLDGIAD